jgi:hypothetical protein
MKKSEWGPIIWKVLHCITIKIKDEEFPKEREQIIWMITNICSNLPCPQCASHASGIIKKHRLKDVKTKAELIKFVYSMHNVVNKRLKKQTYPFNDIQHYYQFNTKAVLSDYYNMNIKSRYSEKMMLYTYHRNEFMKRFYTYFNSNISKFNQ